MLILTRKRGQRILINDNIVIEVVEVKHGNQVRIGITAPKEVVIIREEIKDQRYKKESKND